MTCLSKSPTAMTSLKKIWVPLISWTIIRIMTTETRNMERDEKRQMHEYLSLGPFQSQAKLSTPPQRTLSYCPAVLLKGFFFPKCRRTAHKSADLPAILLPDTSFIRNIWRHRYKIENHSNTCKERHRKSKRVDNLVCNRKLQNKQQKRAQLFFIMVWLIKVSARGKWQPLK